MSGRGIHREIGKELKGHHWKEIEFLCPEDCVVMEVHVIEYSTPRAGLKFRISKLAGNKNPMAPRGQVYQLWGSPEEIIQFKSTCTVGRKVFNPPILIDSGDKLYVEVGRHGKGPTDVDVQIHFFGVAGNGLERALNRIKNP